MNLHSLRRFVPVLALAAILGDLIFLPRLGMPPSAAARYEQCIRLSASEPAKALVFARAWRATRSVLPMAQHCSAIALFAAGDYAHAADAFAGLAMQAASANPALARDLNAQAAKAYDAAGDPDAAQALRADGSK